MEYISYKNSKINEKLRKENNEQYIKTKQEEEKEYFKTMFKNIDKNIKLDEEQIRIILIDEDYHMVIAGAGSGKTTTITAKVNYLIQKKKIKDNEILIISFTNKAVKELDERINKEFKHNIKIQTFHKFGYDIIKENTTTKPKITKNTEKIIKEYFEKEIINDKENLKLLTEILIHFKIIKRKNKINQQLQKNEKEYKNFIQICTHFISLYKSKDNKKIKPKKQIIKKFTILMEDLTKYYQKTLKENNEIDFDDIINEADKIIITKKNKFNYKYIFIDEFQDISESRYKLIKDIAQINNSKIMVVGDDWQCIYSFASSNLDIFTHFQKDITKCEVSKITKTYRNSQQLIDIAGKFIQKNPYQIKKQLISEKQLNNPITIIKYKTNKKTKKLKEIIKYIIKKYGENKKILILGRYTFDIKSIKDPEIKIEDNTIILKNYEKTIINYLTVHSAKGLGYDNVILINTENKKLGFPSKKKQTNY